MMFYALYKWFSNFRKSSYPDMISMYRKYLYDEWYNSLSDDEKHAEDMRIIKIREQRKRDGERALLGLKMMYYSLVNHHRRNYYLFDALDDILLN